MQEALDSLALISNTGVEFGDAEVRDIASDAVFTFIWYVDLLTPQVLLKLR